MRGVVIAARGRRDLMVAQGDERRHPHPLGHRAGRPQAAEQLLPLVYDELRKLAAARMAAENPGHTLDATALVHEAYLRLVGDQHFDGRGHFFAAAAEAMRRILVNHARDRKRLKRGGGRSTARLLDQVGSLADGRRPPRRSTTPSTGSASEDPRRRRAGASCASSPGLSLEEAAEALGLSRRTADRHWKFARAWLARRARRRVIRENFGFRDALPGRTGHCGVGTPSRR